MSTSLSTAGLSLLADPPLAPEPDDARGQLRNELLKPEYNSTNLVQRLLRWLERQVDNGIDTAGGVPNLPWFLATLIGVGLGIAIALLVVRARRDGADESEAKRRTVLDTDLTAKELRERAEKALAEGRLEDAALDGFRTIAVRQVERGRLDDIPGATAHEVARELSREFPAHHVNVDTGADVFDAVMYGDRPASRDQAVAMLTLDDELRRAR